MRGTVYMRCTVWLYFWVTTVCISGNYGITTAHHDQPDESNIPKIATQTTDENLNITLSPSERQKRLLPYQNFYLTQSNQPQEEPTYEPINQDHRFHFHLPPKKTYDLSYQSHPPQDEYYQPSNKFTPFSESNALPGPFRPILPDQKLKVQYVPFPQPHPQKVLDYSAIYDKLAQLKYQQSRRPYVQTFPPAEPQRHVSKPQISFVPERTRYKSIQPSKTTIETFTATNIDIPSGQNYYSPSPPSEQYIKATPVKNFKTDYFQEPSTKPYVNQQIAVEIPHSSFPQQNYKPVVVQTPYQYQGEFVGKPYILVQARPLEQPPPQRQIIVIQRRPAYRNKPPPQVNKEKYIPVSYVTQVPKYEPVTENYQPQYEYQTDRPVTDTPLDVSTVQYEYETIKPITDASIVKYFPPKYVYQTVKPITSPPLHVPTENSNKLGQLLKELQAANTLPHTLTSDNIDNSIKTLVKILESLKKQQKFSKPIVVQDDTADYNEDVENETGAEVSSHVEDIPGTVSQKFPADSPEGGTPGKPGVDYPALSNIPPTSFNCKTQRYKGFFGDPDTNCQVWHYCDLNGGQASFLCPNGTIFSQVALTCDWWYNVKCSSTAQLYVLNERLYKYIIPLSPKFPEDYSGPLVDKYLALKFQEMEEKMRKEKKGKENTSKEKENEELQDIESEITQKEPESEIPTPKSQERETLETIEDDNDQK